MIFFFTLSSISVVDWLLRHSPVWHKVSDVSHYRQSLSLWFQAKTGKNENGITVKWEQAKSKENHFAKLTQPEQRSSSGIRQIDGIFPIYHIWCGKKPHSVQFSSFFRRFSFTTDECMVARMAERKKKYILLALTLKSGSTVCFLNEPIINSEPGSMLIILAYVDFLL